MLIDVADEVILALKSINYTIDKKSTLFLFLGQDLQ
jgi:hypothetical protein